MTIMDEEILFIYTMLGLLTILLLSGWAFDHGAFDHGDFDLWALVRPDF